MSQDEMLTPPEVAEYFKVPLKTVWRWFRNGTLPAVKVGRYWRIRRDKLFSFIEAKENVAHEARNKGQLSENQPDSSTADSILQPSEF